jgi:hypothetical protein
LNFLLNKNELISACILNGPLGQPTNSQVREFTTLIPDMRDSEWIATLLRTGLLNASLLSYSLDLDIKKLPACS